MLTEINNNCANCRHGDICMDKDVLAELIRRISEVKKELMNERNIMSCYVNCNSFAYVNNTERKTEAGV